MKLRDTHMPDTVRCVAEMEGGVWEAFCLDFDLAVQGQTFEDVYQKLNDQIRLYIASATELPESDRIRMLHRRAPLSASVPLLFRVIRSAIFGRGGRPWHDYAVAVDDHAAA